MSAALRTMPNVSLTGRKPEKWRLTMFQQGDYLIGYLVVGRRRYAYYYNLREAWNRALAKLHATLARGGKLKVGGLGKLWSRVKKGAQKAVKSKVWKLAESAAMQAGAALPPPYGPALLAAGAAMKTTRGLVAARAAAAKGDIPKAQAIVKTAKAMAAKYPDIDLTAASRQSKPLYLALVQ